MTIITLLSNIIYDRLFSGTVLPSRFNGNNATFVLKRVKKSISAGAALIKSGYRVNQSFLSVIQQICFK